MKLLIIAALLLVSASFADSPKTGKHLLIKYSPGGVGHLESYEVTIYTEGEFKYISLKDSSLRLSTPLKIIEAEAGGFIAVYVPKDGVDERELEMVMFSGRQNKPNNKQWVCSFARFNSSGPGPYGTYSFLLYPLDSANDDTENVN